MRGKSGASPRSALTFAALRTELTAAIGVPVGASTLLVTLFKIDLNTAEGRLTVGATALLAEAGYLLFLLGWGLWSGRHGRKPRALLAAGCALSLAAGLWLLTLTFTGPPEPAAATSGASTAPVTSTGPGTAASSAATPSSSPGSPPSSSPGGQSGLPPGATTGPGPSTSRPAEPPPTTSNRLVDEPGPTTGRPPPINARHDGLTMSLAHGDDSIWIDYWRKQHEGDGDLNMDQSGIHTTLGAKLKLMPGSAEPGYFDCRNATGWTTRVNFSAMQLGRYLCARSREGRYAWLRVVALPSSPTSNGRFIFDGLVWHKGP